jgi:hypothetical protein
MSKLQNHITEIKFILHAVRKVIIPGSITIVSGIHLAGFYDETFRPHILINNQYALYHNFNGKEDYFMILWRVLDKSKQSGDPDRSEGKGVCT